MKKKYITRRKQPLFFVVFFLLNIISTPVPLSVDYTNPVNRGITVDAIRFFFKSNNICSKLNTAVYCENPSTTKIQDCHDERGKEGGSLALLMNRQQRRRSRS